MVLAVVLVTKCVLSLMNVHHLELFYYVAKFEGITAAVRKMPYGIQQPAVSGQVAQLEKSLGVKLFNRRPFALTPEGEELYDFCYPFFSRLDQIEDKLSGEESRYLRLAASAATMRNHLPEVLEMLREQVPGLRLSLREVEPDKLENLLVEQKIDAAVGVLPADGPGSLVREPLLSLRPALVVPERSGARSLEDLTTVDEFDETLRHGVGPLVGLPGHEVLQQRFEKELEKLRIRWPIAIEVNSTEVVRDYVARGFGTGLGLSIPGREEGEGWRSVALLECEPLVFGLIYQRIQKPVVTLFLEMARRKAASLL